MSTDDSISFGQPKIGPKVYIARGPSGWAQPFPREASDKALAAFVHPVEVDELVDMFVTARDLSETPTDWHTVVGFLARQMQTHPKSVPADVGVAFWAKAILHKMTKGTN